MKICQVEINNFRGIKHASILLPKHAVLIGDNNVGKTTILEAINLVLGPDRLNRFPPIDEHDFFLGEYLFSEKNESSQEGEENNAPVTEMIESGEEESEEDENPEIKINVTIVDLSEEQKRRFSDNIEFWNTGDKQIYDGNITGVDCNHNQEALRVTFFGYYDKEDDDFRGETYFTEPFKERDKLRPFKKKDKQLCGFLYLRSIRSGKRALSLERGSLLDIILRLKEIRPEMWEATLKHLISYDVAGDSELEISGVLKSINSSLRKYVPKEWGTQPQLKISSLTREHLREVITAFIATGEGDHAAPFYRQGTGTLNMLVLAMLSQIAEDRQNVIFAMEEPETALPPYAQKRIVHKVRELSSQAIFTSHSPYVIENFSIDETVILQRDTDGKLNRKEITLPNGIKLKRYHREFRTRFCEGLLSRYVLVVEGTTEAQAFPAACQRLEDINSEKYASLEVLGVCVIDAGSQTQIADIAKLYFQLGKRIFGLCDKQSNENKDKIESVIKDLFMHDEKGFEDLVLKNTSEGALKRFANEYNWPDDLQQKFPDPVANFQEAMKCLFTSNKGNGVIAEFFAQCDEEEIPEWIRNTAYKLKQLCEISSPVDNLKSKEAE